MSRPPLLTSLAQRLDPGRCALLVVDMQNDFCAPGGYVEAVIGKDTSPCRAVAPAVMALVGEARGRGVPVLWIVARYDPDAIPAPMRTKQLEKSETAACVTGSWGAQFHGVSPEPGEPVIAKRSYSAFLDTGLLERLTQLRREVLVFAGVQTNICIENSLRDAFCRGFYCVLAEDCVASHTQALHEATLANVRFLYGDVVTREQIAVGWAAAAKDATPPSPLS